MIAKMWAARYEKQAEISKMRVSNYEKWNANRKTQMENYDYQTTKIIIKKDVQFRTNKRLWVAN